VRSGCTRAEKTGDVGLCLIRLDWWQARRDRMEDMLATAQGDPRRSRMWDRLRQGILPLPQARSAPSGFPPTCALATGDGPNANRTILGSLTRPCPSRLVGGAPDLRIGRRSSVRAEATAAHTWVRPNARPYRDDSRNMCHCSHETSLALPLREWNSDPRPDGCHATTRKGGASRYLRQQRPPHSDGALRIAIDLSARIGQSLLSDVKEYVHW